MSTQLTFRFLQVRTILTGILPKQVFILTTISSLFVNNWDSLLKAPQGTIPDQWPQIQPKNVHWENEIINWPWQYFPHD
jgi:hypothetical protein